MHGKYLSGRRSFFPIGLKRKASRKGGRKVGGWECKCCRLAIGFDSPFVFGHRMKGAETGHGGAVNKRRRKRSKWNLLPPVLLSPILFFLGSNFSPVAAAAGVVAAAAVASALAR